MELKSSNPIYLGVKSGLYGGLRKAIIDILKEQIEKIKAEIKKP